MERTPHRFRSWLVALHVRLIATDVSADAGYLPPGWRVTGAYFASQGCMVWTLSSVLGVLSVAAIGNDCVVKKPLACEQPAERHALSQHCPFARLYLWHRADFGSLGPFQADCGSGCDVPRLTLHRLESMRRHSPREEAFRLASVRAHPPVAA